MNSQLLKPTFVTSTDKSNFVMHYHKTLPFSVGSLRFLFSEVTLNNNQKIYSRVLIGQNNYSCRLTLVCLTKFPYTLSRRGLDKER